MLGRQNLPLTATICLLLLTTLIPSFEARRGGFGRGGGGWGRGWGGGGAGQAYRPVQRSGPSAGKVAGAAAAGAIGGAMIGSALSRPGYGYGGGYGGYGGYGGGYGGYGGGAGYGGYGRFYGNPRVGVGDESGSGDMAFLSTGGSISSSVLVVIGSLMSLLVGRWLTVM